MNEGMKRLVYLGVVIFIVAIVLTAYNKNTEKKAIESASRFVGELFEAKTEYSKASNRLIVEKYVKDEKELYEVTKKVLPFLSSVGEYDVINLLSMRAYYGDNKNDPQFYDIKFKDIHKIRWEMIRNFDDFLNQIGKFN